MALESDRAAQEREEAAVLAKNEQLRANLLRSIGHDLRTPLTAISGSAAILRKSDEKLSLEQRCDLADAIYDDSLWLIDTVENLLAITRVEDGTIRLNLTSELIDEVIEAALSHVAQASHGRAVTIEHTDDILLVRIDVHLIMQVLTNLIMNAFKYTPEDSTVTISARRRGCVRRGGRRRRWAGCGRLRQALISLSASSPQAIRSPWIRVGSIGLGCRSAAPSWRRMAASSKFATTTPMGPSSVLPYPPRRSRFMNNAAKPRILLVEDDLTVQNLVSTALDLHGYVVSKVCDGQAAIMDAVSHGPSLIMLDLGLPDIDGIEVITKIRSWSAVPIIVISARTEDSDKIAALDAGADDYLTKPFSVDELLARVRANLRRSSMASSESTEASTFDNGPLHIDYAAGYATKDGRELSLTPTEYKLLVLLAKKRRQGAHPHLHHPRDMGHELGQRSGEPARVHAHPAQEDRGRPLSPQDDSDAHGCRVPHAASLAHPKKSCGGIRSR